MRSLYIVVLLSLLLSASFLSAQQVNPSALSFESIPPKASPQEVLTFTNTGTAELTLSFSSVPAPFAIIKNACQTHLKPGKHCSLYLTYTAKTVGEKDSGALVIDYGEGSVSVPLNGAGVSSIATEFLKTWNDHPDIRLGEPVYVYATFTLSDPYYYQVGCGGKVVWSCSNGQGGTGRTSGGVKLVGGGLCVGGPNFKGDCFKSEGEFVPDQKGNWSCTVTYSGDSVCGKSSSSDHFHVF